MKKLLWGSILAGFAFLVGFLPQRSTITHLREEVSTVQQDLASCLFRAKLADLRDLAALMYLEANQKNYSLASTHSTRFFDRVRGALSEAENPSLRQGLQELLDLRDTTTSELATGDSAVVTAIQDILVKIHQITAGG